MAKTEKRQKRMADKRTKRQARADNPGMVSRYARKKKYCDKHGVWGFEVPEPKPWR